VRHGQQQRSSRALHGHLRGSLLLLLLLLSQPQAGCISHLEARRAVHRALGMDI
jgi:hypothetical protein